MGETSKQVQQTYIPSSVEIKRVVMMYFLLGLMIALQKTEMSLFEYFHLRQAIGWWISFVVVLLALLILLLIPYVSILAVIILIAMIAIGAIYIKQAIDGKHYSRIEQAFLPIFVGVGGWVLDVFEVHILTPDQQNIAQSDKTTENK